MNAPQTEFMSLTTFGGAILAFIVFVLYKLVPIYIKRLEQRGEIESEKDNYELEIVKRETIETAQAQQVLTQIGIETINQLRDMVKKNEERVVELQDVNAKHATDIAMLSVEYQHMKTQHDTKQREIERIMSEMSVYQRALNDTKELLSISQGQIEKMKLEIVNLQEEIKRLQAQSASLEHKLETERMQNKRLQDMVLSLQGELKEKEESLRSERETSESLRKRERELLTHIRQLERRGITPDSDEGGQI